MTAVKVRSCQFPFCIHEAFETCKECHLWFCADHLPKNGHKCKKMVSWSLSSPMLNAAADLGPGDVSAGRKRREWWRGGIEP